MLLITPHGDWKQGLTNQQAAQQNILITPHGIGNSSRSRITFTGYLNSLPLMGIGNSAILPGEDHRKWGLITPHGDWKHGEIPMRALLAGNSLPLMGIGNLASTPRASSMTGISLPLMGIGNGKIWSCNISHRQDSLPLMGIGNRRENAHGLLRQPQLITPHGDWKLFSVPRDIAPMSRSMVSLPLMGIGNW